MNPNQPALIRGAVQKLAQGSRILVGTDNDDGGHKLAEQIEPVQRGSGCGDPGCGP
jgi:hypothetical protein